MSGKRPHGRPVPPVTEIKPGGFYVLNVQHDDGCPTIHSQRQSECTCSEVIERIVDAETYWKQLLKKGGAQ